MTKTPGRSGSGWLERSEKLLAEVPELLSYSEHAMYIGQKI